MMKDMLYDAYMEVVQGYGFTRVDFDVEARGDGLYRKLTQCESSQTTTRYYRSTSNVDITCYADWFDFDWTIRIASLFRSGVDLTNVNIMTMCYGPSVIDYAQGSLDAVDNTMVQLKNHYRQYAGITLTDEEAYAKLGTTPSIGFENEQHPYFDRNVQSSC